MDLTVSTFNIQGFFSWDDRKANVISYLRESSADIIFLQEVTYIPQVSAYTQASIIKQELPAYIFEASAVTRLQDSPDYSVYREGLAAISKHPIVYSETLVLKKDPADEHQRLLQLVDVRRSSGEIVKFANVHLSITDSTEVFARAQLEEVLQILAARNETRVICGDFNMKDLNLHADLWGDEYNASNDHVYVTVPDEQKQIDYFLLPKSMSYVSVGLSPENLSDHCALTVKICTKKPTGVKIGRIAQAKKLLTFAR